MGKERPILFSAPMVRAIGEMRKTQTRRIVKPQPHPEATHVVHDGEGYFFDYRMDGAGEEMLGGKWWCPYGEPGDRLWVKEKWAMDLAYDNRPPSSGNSIFTRWLAADDSKGGPWNCNDQRGKWRSPLYMPRWAARYELPVTAVRMERVQDITEADAIAEGCIMEADGFPAVLPHKSGIGDVGWDDAREWYADMWDDINGEGAWDENPWVWVVTFKPAAPVADAGETGVGNGE